jgi:hypothetical protein
MSKLNALKKAMESSKKVYNNKKVRRRVVGGGLAAGAGKLAFDGLTREPKPEPKRKNPNEKGTRPYIEWEIREQKRRGELPGNYPEKLPPPRKGTIPDVY